MFKRLIWTLSFSVLAFSQDAVKIGPRVPPYETGQLIYADDAATDLELRQLPGEYLVLAKSGTRQVIAVGDQIGKEHYLVLAIDKGKALIQRKDGYGILYADEKGQTRLQELNRADLPASFFEALDSFK